MGAANTWDAPGESELAPRRLLTWRQAREVAGRGIAFGAHSISRR